MDMLAYRGLAAGLVLALGATALPGGTAAAAPGAEPVVIHGAVPGTGPTDGQVTVLEDGLGYYSGHAPASGGEPWVTDGTRSGTRMVADVVPGAGSSGTLPFAVMEGRYFFTRDDDVHGRELWVTDGTQAGTGMLRDVWPGSSSSWPSNPFVHDGLLYFAATESLRDTELWVTDGSAAGTRRLKEISPAPETSSNPSGFGLVGGNVVFAAASGAAGGELWTTDGTEAGTRMVVDANPGPESSVVRDLTFTGDRVFYLGTRDDQDGDGSPDPSGYELWSSDGTPDGTGPVEDILPGAGTSFVDDLTPVGDRVAFHARSSGTDYEPWVSDGTAEGTFAFADLRPGAEGSRPGSFQVVGSASRPRVVFRANTASTDLGGLPGSELWVSDLTASGTRALRGIPGLSTVGGVLGWSAWRGQAVFADSDASGVRHWITDGTIAGTRPITRADAWLGGDVIDDQLVFPATTSGPDGDRDVLWSLSLQDATATPPVVQRARASRTTVSLTGAYGQVRARVRVAAGTEPPAGRVSLVANGRAVGTYALRGRGLDVALPRWVRPERVTVVASYGGTAGVAASRGTVQKQVRRAPATVKVTQKRPRSTVRVIRVTVRSSLGRPGEAARVTVTRHGRVVGRGRTNRSGVATVRLRTLPRGKASVTVRWAGTSTVAAVSTRARLTA